jgi:hypothetical protein
MRFPALILFALSALCPPAVLAQATLNKCIDAQGKITYSNQPCRNARESRTLEIDPPPIPDKPRVQIAPTPPAVSTPAKVIPEPATTQLETRQIVKSTSPSGKTAQNTSAKQCDALSDKLGKKLDAMDQARRKGYTLEQMNKWNEEVRELEKQKQQSGCF